MLNGAVVICLAVQSGAQFHADATGQPYSFQGDGMGEPSYSGDEWGRGSYSSESDGLGEPSYSSSGDEWGKPSYSPQSHGLGEPSYFSTQGDEWDKPSYSPQGDEMGEPSYSDQGDEWGKSSYSSQDNEWEKPSYSSQHLRHRGQPSHSSQSRGQAEGQGGEDEDSKGFSFGATSSKLLEVAGTGLSFGVLWKLWLQCQRCGKKAMEVDYVTHDGGMCMPGKTVVETKVLWEGEECTYHHANGTTRPAKLKKIETKSLQTHEEETGKIEKQHIAGVYLEIDTDSNFYVKAEGVVNIKVYDPSLPSHEVLPGSNGRNGSNPARCLLESQGRSPDGGSKARGPDHASRARSPDHASEAKSHLLS